jgi:hypothetical protein
MPTMRAVLQAAADGCGHSDAKSPVWTLQLQGEKVAEAKCTEAYAKIKQVEEVRTLTSVLQGRPASPPPTDALLSYRACPTDS